MEDWMLGPPLLIGDHVAYSCDSGAFLNGTVRWMGRVSALYGQQMVVGVELDEPLHDGRNREGRDGLVNGKRYFSCRRSSGLLSKIDRISKIAAPIGVHKKPLEETKRQIGIELFIEDENSCRGPLRMEVDNESTIGDLRRRVKDEFDIGCANQRWIHGKRLLTDESCIREVSTDLNNRFFLFVGPEGGNQDVKPPQPPLSQPKRVAPPAATAAAMTNVEKSLESVNLVPNTDEFECPICFVDYEPGEGVVLRECFHTFCKPCLKGTIQNAEAAVVKCPYTDQDYSCDMQLLDREMKSILSEAEYKAHEKKSLQQARTAAEDSFHCRTAGCQGWCFVNEDDNVYKCELCQKENCLTCQAIHTDMDCKQYQRSLLEEDDEDTKKTNLWIKGMVDKGDAIHCPNCQVLLLKKWGCDWLKCTYCKTEICWVTRLPRWGPNGRGDTSGGCKCMVGGKKCHPSCNYCH